MTWFSALKIKKRMFVLHKHTIYKTRKKPLYIKYTADLVYSDYVFFYFHPVCYYRNIPRVELNLTSLCVPGPLNSTE